MFTDATTTMMLSSVRKCLEKNLEKKYNIKDEKIVEEILKIHGISKDNFDFIRNIERVINGRLSDNSIDKNANKSEKTIAAIQQELTSSVNKVLGFDYLYKTMKELYGKEEANRLMGEMLDLSLGISDSTKIMIPYCWAMDASKIVTIGRDFGQLESAPSKRVSSYIAALSETVHQISNHIAGACAIGSFFFDIAHLLLYKEKLDLRDLQTSIKIRKDLENEFQQFVHAVNHLSRLGSESPFTNISIFDKVKLKTFIKEMNWYFNFDELSIKHKNFDEIEDEQERNKKRDDYYLDYIIEFIMEIQKIFIEFFDKGDPNKNGIPYRFPVVTLNLSIKKWGDKTLIEDEEFLKYVCKKEIFRYNIFVSDANKISSCCRLLSDIEMLDLASHSNSFGGSSISLGSHRVVTINLNRIAIESKSKKEYIEILNNRIEDTAKILKSHKTLIKKLEKNGLQPFITNGWINMNRMFSTFGIMGEYEAAIYAKEKYNDLEKNEDFIETILVNLNQKMLEIAKKYELIPNCEEIPGESFAIRFAKIDKMLFGKNKTPYELLSNQFVPLWENVSIWERMDLDGKYNKLLTGGSIVHINIGEKVTTKQIEKIIKYSINSKCTHFALNAVYSMCEKGHCTFGKIDKCPTCEGKIIDYYTRIIGFYTPISTWQDIRRDWEFPNRKFVEIE